jgi:flagellar basal-body rod modification protein FlgD
LFEAEGIEMEIQSASSQMMDYLNLLVTELQNQNPLEPMDNQQMASQLAQFSQLQETEQMNDKMVEMNETMGKLNTSFYNAMIVAEYDYAKSLLGKEVSFYSGYYERYLNGDVESIQIVNGKPELEVHAMVTHPDGSTDLRAFLVKLNEVEGIRE